MIGAIIRGLRVKCGDSQERMAEAVGISQPQLSAIELERRNPSWTFLLRAEKHFRRYSLSLWKALAAD